MCGVVEVTATPPPRCVGLEVVVVCCARPSSGRVVVVVEVPVDEWKVHE
jgi:hypothetical protein